MAQATFSGTGADAFRTGVVTAKVALNAATKNEMCFSMLAMGSGYRSGFPWIYSVLAPAKASGIWGLQYVCMLML